MFSYGFPCSHVPMMSPKYLYNISIIFHTDFMTCHIHSAKMEWDGLNAPHSNWCKGPISPCQSIQRWNDVLFMYLYELVDILIRVVSIIFKCKVVFSQHSFVGLSWFVASNIFNCIIASCIFTFVFWSWIKTLQICSTNSIFHFFNPKSTYKQPNQHLDFFDNDLKT